MPRYDKQFITDAVDLFINGDRSISALARDLGIPNQTLSKWIKNAEANGSITKDQKELREENIRLKKELAQVKMERDILKKATAFFAREK